MSARYVTIEKYAEMSGYTASAIRHKIERGIWMEGREYRCPPDNRKLIDVEGVERWVRGERVAA